MKTETEDKGVSFRRYPSIALPAAVSLVRSIYEKDKRTPVSYTAAATAMGHGSLSGPARMKVASIKNYGLLDAVGENVQVSPLAMRLLHQNDDVPDYRAAAKEAALRPELFRKLAETHLEASQDTIASHLLLKMQLSDDGARVAAKAFKETIAFAKLDNTEYTPASEADKGKASGSSTAVTPVVNPPPAPKTTVNATTVQPGELPVPIGDGLVARVPFPMTEEDFDLFVETLKLWKKRLTRRPAPAQRTFPCRAIWKNNDSDKPVTIVADLGEKDGQKYFQSEDGTGIPSSELWFNP